MPLIVKTRRDLDCLRLVNAHTGWIQFTPNALDTNRFHRRIFCLTTITGCRFRIHRFEPSPGAEVFFPDAS